MYDLPGTNSTGLDPHQEEDRQEVGDGRLGVDKVPNTLRRRVGVGSLQEGVGTDSVAGDSRHVVGAVDGGRTLAAAGHSSHHQELKDSDWIKQLFQFCLYMLQTCKHM